MKVFVYGTLRKDGANPASNYGAKFVQHDSVQGTLYDLGAFPGWRCDDVRAVVIGDVYEVDDIGLAMLDRYESEGRLYKRTTITTDRGEEAFIYELMDWVMEYNKLSPITSGDWVLHGYSKD